MNLMIFTLIMLAVGLLATVILGLFRLDGTAVLVGCLCFGGTILLFFTALGNMEVGTELESYEVVDATLASGGKRYSPSYTVSFTEKGEEVTVKTPFKVFVTDGEERVAKCECRWWILTDEEYVYYVNRSHNDQLVQEALVNEQQALRGAVQ
jgi:hypothetical protein